MSYVGSKTPVSILNEYFVSSRTVPRFDLIEQIMGQSPKFTYRVTAGGYSAEGSGTSKQQAKHISAQLLIDILRKRQEMPGIGELDKAVQEISVPQDNVISFNAVGDLTTYCMDKSYPEPVYDLVSDDGPPHARIFTCQCTVSKLSELGAARTKKQAKHHAAFAMLGRLKQLCNEEHNSVVKFNPEKAKTTEMEHKKKKDDEATCYYMQYAKGDSRRYGPTPVYIADQYRSYAKLMDRSETLVALSKDEDLIYDSSILDTIALELGEKLITTCASSYQSDIFFVSLDVIPKLVIAGESEEEAKVQALKVLYSML